MEAEEIRRVLQESRRSHLEEREEQLEHSGTIRDGGHKPDGASTTEEETEIHQKRNQIHKLREKTESTYQVTHIEMDKRPRLQKIQNMFKIEAIMQMTNKAMEEILDGKDLNTTELNHLIYTT